MPKSLLELRELDVILLKPGNELGLDSSNRQVTLMQQFLELGHGHGAVVLWLEILHFHWILVSLVRLVSSLGVL